MTDKRFPSTARKVLQVLAVALAVSMTSSNLRAQIVIFRFNQTTGARPQGRLISDSAGNLYGTATDGGHVHLCVYGPGCGVVFKLSPASGGGWTQSVLYAFRGGTDGEDPIGTLVFDNQGNLYGTTLGMVFKLTPGSGGAWTKTVVHNFSGADGIPPNSDLIFDSAGNLYGTTSSGGAYFSGDVFELSPQSDGSWSETVLHSFNPNNGDGIYPFAGVTIDGKGNLYGTTEQGGSNRNGTVFELTPQGNGVWSEALLYSFTNGSDGGFPESLLTIDSSGNLLGTTISGGANFGGTVFQLSPASGGKWTESVLHSFGPAPNDGTGPSGPVVFDTKGNLYGSTRGGGNGCNNPGCGIVFRLTPQSGGTWNETIVHQFESASDGSRPAGGLLLDNSTARLYGTTSYGGGRYGYGTVYEYKIRR